MEQPTVRFDPADVATLRNETKNMSERIDNLLARIENHPDAFDAIEATYRTHLQPKIIGLVEAMLHYVPNDDPRIMMEFASGGFRRFKSDDATMASYLLSKETAEVHLRVILEKLDQLAKYVPQ